MSISTEALVLRSRDFSEHDRILTLLSREEGVITAFANGVRNIKSKLAAGCGTFTYARFELRKKRDTYTVASAEPIELFYGLRTDMQKLALAGYFAQLAQSFVTDGGEAAAYLRLILNSLYLLEHDKRPPELLKPLFELRTLSLVGFMPDLVACRHCRRYEAEGGMWFDYSGGSLLCCDCAAQGQSIPERERQMLSPGVLAAMRHIVFSADEKLFSFRLSPESTAVLGRVCERYLLSRSEQSYRALEFYRSMI